MRLCPSLFLVALAGCTAPRPDAGTADAAVDAGGSDAGPLQCVLTVLVSGDGTVTSSPAGLACSPDAGPCRAPFGCGTSLTLHGLAAGKGRLAGWSVCDGGGEACVIALVADQTASAQFVRQFDVDVHVLGPGAVSSPLFPIPCSGTCTARVDENASVSFDPMAAADARWLQWSAPCAAAAPHCALTVRGDLSLHADFKRVFSGAFSADSARVRFDDGYRNAVGEMTLIGSLDGAANLAGVPLGATNLDLLVIRVGADGGVQWLLRSTNDAGSAEAHVAGRVPDGGFVVGGRYTETLNLPGLSLPAPAAQNSFLLKLDETGAVQQRLTWSSPSHFLSDVDVSPSGAVVASVVFSTALSFGGGLSVSTANADTALVLLTADLKPTQAWTLGASGAAARGVARFRPDGLFVLADFTHDIDLGCGRIGGATPRLYNEEWLALGWLDATGACVRSGALTGPAGSEAMRGDVAIAPNGDAVVSFLLRGQVQGFGTTFAGPPGPAATSLGLMRIDSAAQVQWSLVLRADAGALRGPARVAINGPSVLLATRILGGNLTTAAGTTACPVGAGTMDDDTLVLLLDLQTGAVTWQTCFGDNGAVLAAPNSVRAGPGGFLMTGEMPSTTRLGGQVLLPAVTTERRNYATWLTP